MVEVVGLVVGEGLLMGVPVVWGEVCKGVDGE